VRFPILRGPLRGLWWSLASRGKVGRVITGTYEPEQTAVVRSVVGAGDVVLDIGAHAGYYSLLSSLLAGPSGAVWAFEPDPRNHAALQRHLRINRRSNVSAVRAAVADVRGVARFQAGHGSGTGKLSPHGPVEVEVIRLDDFCGERGIRPTVLKIDVEGAELEVLAGAPRLLERERPAILLSTHGPELHRSAISLLQDAGYELRPIVGPTTREAPEILATPAPRRAPR
jgi:FkbM family methyltransferase